MGFSNMNFNNVLNNGTYFNPAWRRYSSAPCKVFCDRCNKEIASSYNFEEIDLCVKCFRQLKNNQNYTKPTSLHGMIGGYSEADTSYMMASITNIATDMMASVTRPDNRRQYVTNMYSSVTKMESSKTRPSNMRSRMMSSITRPGNNRCFSTNMESSITRPSNRRDPEFGTYMESSITFNPMNDIERYRGIDSDYGTMMMSSITEPEYLRRY